MSDKIDYLPLPRMLAKYLTPSVTRSAESPTTAKVLLPFLGIGVLVAFWLLTPVPPESDAANYWSLDLADPYRNRWADQWSFVYSPAFGQLIYPLTLLPMEIAYKVFQAVNLACLWWLAGPWSAVALALPPVQAELATNNIHLPLTVMSVAMVRHPSLWAFGALTKVTPGVTILWWVGRREWRHAAIALGVTAGIVAVSAAVWPSAWVEWLGLLVESSTRHVTNFSVSEWPAIFRLPIAAGLTVMAAWRNRPAALPVIVLFSLPTVWFGALAMLAAVLPAHAASGLHGWQSRTPRCW